MRRRAQLIESLRHRSRYRLNIELSREAREVLARALEEDPSITSLTTLINRIIVEWATMRNRLNVSGLEEEVSKLEKKLKRINKWLDTIDKRLIRITARTGFMLMRQGEEP